MKYNDKRAMPLLEQSELEVNGVYFSKENELIKIEKIDKVRNELSILNISAQYHQVMKINKHDLVKRVR